LLRVRSPPKVSISRILPVLLVRLLLVLPWLLLCWLLGPLAFFGLTDLFIVALAIWDFRTRGRLHPVTLWGGLLIIVSQPLRLVVSGTAGWLAFARWATGLLG